MTPSHSSARRKHSDRGDYGFARIRDVAFDAIRAIWHRRRSEGVRQTDLAHVLNRDPAWVSKQLSGPANWTLRTVGELAEALDAEIHIHAIPYEETGDSSSNYDAYAEYLDVARIPTNAVATVVRAELIGEVRIPAAARHQSRFSFELTR